MTYYKEMTKYLNWQKFVIILIIIGIQIGLCVSLIFISIEYSKKVVLPQQTDNPSN